jgi:GAF domain-containing protein
MGAFGHEEPSTRYFADAALEFARESTPSTVLCLLARIASQLTAATDAAVSTRQPRGRLAIEAGTSEVALQLEELQAELREGPGATALAVSGAVVVHDSEKDSRFARWAPSALSLGMRSAVAVPIGDDARSLGSLTILATEPDAFDAATVDALQILAVHASLAYVSSRARAELGEAVATRTLIGQAQGILMERYSLDTDRAFQVLRRYSRDNNVKLVEIARLIVGSGGLPEL